MMEITKDQQIENCLQGLAMLDEIPNHKIIPKLNHWCNGELLNDPTSCGAAACFGGWVAVHPHFQKYGVYPISGASIGGSPGAPRTEEQSHPSNVALLLFGKHNMFFQNSTDTHSDRRVIRDRLHRALTSLLKD